MSFIDAILNFAGLLLWLKWRGKGQELSARGISLITTLKKAGPHYPRFYFPLALLMLLIARTILYWQLGSALDWTPQIWFGLIPLSFRSDFFWRIFLFSFVSFGAALTIFYLCLLLISILNSKRAEADPIQNLARVQLGKLDFLPRTVKLLLPWFTMILLWCIFNKPLAALGLLPTPKSFAHLVEQGAVAGFAIYFVWKYLIVAVLLLYLLNSYIYFGAWPFWIFIDQTATQMLKPFSWIPLRAKKIDFAPVVAIAVIILASEFGARGLIWIYQLLPF
ncbi:MAG: hypothetical protein ABIP71_03315 [Verrucomicrobiota bacterium]